MARVTVEDCAEVVQNRFELVALASQRSKSIASGSPITIERDNDKNPVVSLREIACDAVDSESLHERFIRSMQKHLISENDNSDEEVSLEEEFAAYLYESKSSEVNEEILFTQTNVENNESFEDVSDDLLKKED